MAATPESDARLERLAEPYLAHEGVAWGRMFSTTGLSVRGKIFGVVNHEGALMVKVPEARADELEEAGAAARIVMRGRPMREWVEMPFERGESAWEGLLGEAFAYVDSITA